MRKVLKNKQRTNDLALNQAQEIDNLKKELKNSNQESEELKEDLALLLEGDNGLVSENELKYQQTEFLKKKQLVD